MDPNDEILAHLKRAQSRGLEAVSNRLGFVIESLEELVTEAKSSVGEAVPDDPEELFPIADLEAAISALRARATAAEERAERLTAERGAAAEPGIVAGVTLEWIRRLDRARSQSEVLRELLPLLAENAARAVVLVVRGNAVSAWSGIGLADAERLRSWSGQLDASPALRRLVDDNRPLRFVPAADPLVAEWLAGEPGASEALLLPVVLHGKTMGAIYADRVEGREWRPEVVQALVATTCWLIDTLAHRQSVPTPTVAEALDLVGERPLAKPPEEEPIAEAAPLEAAESVAPPPEPEAAVEPEFDPSATVQVELGAGVVPETLEEVSEPAAAVEAPPEVGPPEAELEAAVEPAPPEAEAAPEVEPASEVEAPPPEPPPVSPVVPPPAEPARLEPPAEGAALSAEEETQHEEARRFARLLVSEIKLYNEEEVERGRSGGDLYQRLKEDIDRSREMFEKRIAPEIRTVRDYFHEELVRILADGDADVLGM